ncbi:MAG: hypothetical protein ISS34_07530, partial [Candidatus Omnitrophica bacterium]|nr:hypothetical protein [Candidatus Omnitrophota bacterium]
MRITIYHKIIALATAILFVLNILGTDIAWAFRAESTSAVTSNNTPSSLRAPRSGAKQSLEIDEFEIPAKLGEVKDRHKGSGGTIIYIQDAHCNYAAQKAISNIIGHLNEEYGIDLISLEGGAGDYDLSLFTDIENEDTRGRVSDYFMKQGRVSGPEFFAINNPGKVKLYGVEDADLYIKNLDVYRDSLKYVTDTNNALNYISSRIEELKKHIYTENLFKLDSDYRKFKEDKIDLKEFIEYLFELSLERRISLREFPNVRAIYEAISKEKGIDFERANSERFDLINELKEALPRHDLDRFTLKTFLFKTGQLSEAAYHNYLKDISDRYKVNFNRKPNLKDYITYINLYEKADKLEVFNEIEDLFELVIDKEFKDDTQKTLFRTSKHAEILKNIFNIKATRDEINYYNSHKHEFGISTIIDFIERLSLKYGESPHFDNSARLIDKRRDEMLKFYKYALSRDAAFVKNIKRAHKQFTNDASIIVAGGFHNENLSAIFKENDLSYIVIRPVFKNGDGYKSPYYKLLSGGLSDMEEEIVAAISALAIASVFNGLAVKFYGQAPYEALRNNLEIAELICESIMQNGNFLLRTKTNGTVEFTFERGRLVAKNLEVEPDKVHAELEEKDEQAAALLRENLDRLPKVEGVTVVAATSTLAEKVEKRAAAEEPTAAPLSRFSIKNLLRRILPFILPAFVLLFVAAEWGLLGYGATLLIIVGGAWGVGRIWAQRTAYIQSPSEKLALELLSDLRRAWGTADQDEAERKISLAATNQGHYRGNKLDPRIFIRTYIEEIKKTDRGNARERQIAATALMESLLRASHSDFGVELHEAVPEIQEAAELLLGLAEEGFDKSVVSLAVRASTNYTWLIPLFVKEIGDLRKKAETAKESGNAEQAGWYNKLAEDIESVMRSTCQAPFGRDDFNSLLGLVGMFTVAFMGLELSHFDGLPFSEEDYQSLNFRTMQYLGTAASSTNFREVMDSPISSDRARIMILLWKKVVARHKEAEERFSQKSETGDDEEAQKAYVDDVFLIIIEHNKLVEMLLEGRRCRDIGDLGAMLFGDDNDSRLKAARMLLWLSKFGNEVAVRALNAVPDMKKLAEEEWNRQNRALNEELDISVSLPAEPHAAKPGFGTGNIIKAILPFILPAFALLFVAAEWGLLGYGATLLTIVGGVWGARKLLARRRVVWAEEQELLRVNIVRDGDVLRLRGEGEDILLDNQNRAHWVIADMLLEKIKHMALPVEIYEALINILNAENNNILPFWKGERFSLVLRELVANAVESIGQAESGDVEIAFWVSRDNRLEISIKDTGVGLGGVNRRRIFRKDYSTRFPLDPDPEWRRGVGLYNSREFVRKILGGDIKAFDNLRDLKLDHSGATFRITIPLKRRPSFRLVRLLQYRMRTLVFKRETTPSKGVLIPSLLLVNGLVLIINFLLGIFNRLFGTKLTLTASKAEKEDIAVPLLEEGIILGIASLTGWGIIPYIGIRIAFIAAHLIQDRIMKSERTAYQSMLFPTLISVGATIAFLACGATFQAFIISSLIHGVLNNIVTRYFPQHDKDTLLPIIPYAERREGIIDPRDINTGQVLVDVIEETRKKKNVKSVSEAVLRSLVCTGYLIFYQYSPYLNREGQEKKDALEALYNQMRQGTLTWSQERFEEFRDLIDTIPTIKNPHEELFVDLDLTPQQLRIFAGLGFRGWLALVLTSGCLNRCSVCGLGRRFRKIHHMPFPMVVRVLKRVKTMQNTLQPYYDSDPIHYHDKVINATLVDVISKAEEAGFTSVAFITHGVGGELKAERAGSLVEQTLESRVVGEGRLKPTISLHIYDEAETENLLDLALRRKWPEELLEVRDRLKKKFKRRFLPILRAVARADRRSPSKINVLIKYFLRPHDNIMRRLRAQYPNTAVVIEEIHKLQDEIWQEMRNDVFKEFGVDVEEYKKPETYLFVSSAVGLLRNLAEAADGVNFEDRSEVARFDRTMRVSQVIYEERNTRMVEEEFTVSLRPDPARGAILTLELYEGYRNRYRTVKEMFDREKIRQVGSIERNNFLEFLRVLKILTAVDFKITTIEETLYYYGLLQDGESEGDIQKYIADILGKKKAADVDPELLRSVSLEVREDTAEYFRLLTTFVVSRPELTGLLRDPEANLEMLYDRLADVPFPITIAFRLNTPGGDVDARHKVINRGHRHYRKKVDNSVRVFILPVAPFSEFKTAAEPITKPEEVLILSEAARAPPVRETTPSKGVLISSLLLVNGLVLIINFLLGLFNLLFGTKLTLTASKAEREDIAVPLLEEGIILGIVSLTGWGIIPYIGIRIAFILAHLIQDKIAGKDRTAYQSMLFPTLISAGATLAFLIFGATPLVFVVSSAVHGLLNNIVERNFPQYGKGVLGSGGELAAQLDRAIRAMDIPELEGEALPPSVIEEISAEIAMGNRGILTGKVTFLFQADMNSFLDRLLEAGAPEKRDEGADERKRIDRVMEGGLYRAVLIIDVEKGIAEVHIPVNGKLKKFSVAPTFRPGVTRIGDLEIVVDGRNTNFIDYMVETGFAPEAFKSCRGRLFIERHIDIGRTRTGEINTTVFTLSGLSFDAITGEITNFFLPPGGTVVRIAEDGHIQSAQEEVSADEEPVLKLHNHGSYDPMPSDQDVKSLKRITDKHNLPRFREIIVGEDTEGRYSFSAIQVVESRKGGVKAHIEVFDAGAGQWQRQEEAINFGDFFLSGLYDKLGWVSWVLFPLHVICHEVGHIRSALKNNLRIARIHILKGVEIDLSIQALREDLTSRGTAESEETLALAGESVKKNLEFANAGIRASTALAKVAGIIVFITFFTSTNWIFWVAFYVAAGAIIDVAASRMGVDGKRIAEAELMRRELWRIGDRARSSRQQEERNRFVETTVKPILIGMLSDDLDTRGIAYGRLRLTMLDCSAKEEFGMLYDLLRTPVDIEGERITIARELVRGLRDRDRVPRVLMHSLGVLSLVVAACPHIESGSLHRVLTDMVVV